MFRYISNRVLQSSLLFLLSLDKLFAVIAGPTKKPNIAACQVLDFPFFSGGVSKSGAESARLPSDLERGSLTVDRGNGTGCGVCYFSVFFDKFKSNFKSIFDV